MNAGKTLYLALALCMLMVSASTAWAKDLTISLGEIPGQAELDDTGQLTGDMAELAKLMQKHYTDGELKIVGPHPLEDSLALLVSGEVDAHMPLICSESANIPYAFASTPLLKVKFALYSRNDAPELDTSNLLDKIIEIQAGHEELAPIPTVGGKSMPSSLERLQKGLIDGYLAEAVGFDAHLEKNGVALRKQDFLEFDGCVAIAQGEEGEATDKALAKLLKKLEGEAEYQEVLKRLAGE